jgi:hypothetical protein
VFTQRSFLIKFKASHGANLMHRDHFLTLEMQRITAKLQVRGALGEGEGARLMFGPRVVFFALSFAFVLAVTFAAITTAKQVSGVNRPVASRLT